MGFELPDTGFNPQAHAPAVTYPLSRPRLLLGLLVLVLCLALCVDLAWLALGSVADWRPWVGLLATAGVAAWCVWQAPLTVSGSLCWDGHDWWWENAAGPQHGSIQARLDTQSGLLVRMALDAGASHWLWLSQASEPGRWLALRRAIHAPGRTQVIATSSAPAPHS